jgi:pyruvate formate lyase activating enzyme
MIIGGIQKFSLLDYPDHLSAIVFTQGCNFRCQFCYNPMLVLPLEEGKIKNTSSSKIKTGEEIKEGDPRISEDAFFDFLKSRVGKLDAIVITGGEPTLQADLPAFIGKIRALGFKVKLDTNGTNPDMIKKLISAKLIDYMAMDLKSSLDKYEQATGVKVNLDNIKRSIKIIIESGLPYEFRTTVVPDLSDLDDIKEMAQLIKGADKWYIQRFKSDTDLINTDFQGLPPHSEEAMLKMVEVARHFVKVSELR